MKKIITACLVTSMLSSCGAAFDPHTKSATPTGVYEGESQGERAASSIMIVLLGLGIAAYYATYNQ